MEEIERVNFYIGDLGLGQSTERDPKLLTHNSERYKTHSNMPKLGHDVLLSQVRKVSKEPFYWFSQEVNKPVPPYVLVRARLTTSGVLVNSLVRDRMWGDVHNPPKDMPFKNKKDEIFWRGASSASGRRRGRAYRTRLVEEHFSKHDVRFSHPKKEGHPYLKRFDVNRYVKGSVPLEKFLEYKYLISVEGNDNDSSLRWKLASNSLVIMPKLTCQTWLIEPNLKPGVHYVEVSDDWSDLDSKLEWCRDNQDRCLEIVENANRYIDNFRDYERETEIELEVLREYFKKL